MQCCHGNKPTGRSSLGKSGLENRNMFGDISTVIWQKYRTIWGTGNTTSNFASSREFPGNTMIDYALLYYSAFKQLKREINFFFKNTINILWTLHVRIRLVECTQRRLRRRRNNPARPRWRNAYVIVRKVVAALTSQARRGSGVNVSAYVPCL